MRKYSFHAHLGLSVHEFNAVDEYIRVFLYVSNLWHYRDDGCTHSRECLLDLGYVIHERDMEI